MVREAGLEPATSRLSAGCSNRLSHPRLGSLGDLTFRHKHDGWRNGSDLRSESLFFHAVDRDVRRQLHHLLKGARKNDFV